MWQHLLIGLFFFLALAYVAWRLYRAFDGGQASGCAGGCGHCPVNPHASELPKVRSSD